MKKSIAIILGLTSLTSFGMITKIKKQVQFLSKVKVHRDFDIDTLAKRDARDVEDLFERVSTPENDMLAMNKVSRKQEVRPRVRSSAERLHEDFPELLEEINLHFPNMF